MEKLDGNFDAQRKIINADKVYYIADMHELINPNDSARKIVTNINGRSPTDAELLEIYENCDDPLIKAFEQVILSPSGRGRLVISLGDLVLNRVDFGEGTEKSIVGKLAKKARELSVSQHEYIAQQAEAHRQELQEYAHRNNMWTGLRFKALDNISWAHKPFTFAHLNGNADVLASLVSSLVLPNERAPKAIYRNSWAMDGYFEELPGIISIASGYYGTDEHHIGELAIAVPHTFDFGKSTEHLKTIKSELDRHTTENSGLFVGSYGSYPEEFGIGATYLLIHEAVNPEQFGKQEKVEGLDTYKTAMSIWPIHWLLHGHTHDKSIVGYEFLGHPVFQIPPNRAVTIWDIFFRSRTVQQPM